MGRRNLYIDWNLFFRVEKKDFARSTLNGRGRIVGGSYKRRHFMAFVFVNVLSYTYYVTTSTLKVGDQRGRIQDVRRETETLPGESMGHRKGQATCSSPIHRISAHNYMSERASELSSILFWRPKVVGVSLLLSFGRRHYRAHCHIFAYCEHSRVAYNKTCPRTGNYALNTDVPRTRTAFFSHRLRRNHHLHRHPQ